VGVKKYKAGLKHIIEVDGGQHSIYKKRDIIRDKYHPHPTPLPSRERVKGIISQNWQNPLFQRGDFIPLSQRGVCISRRGVHSSSPVLPFGLRSTGSPTRPLC